MNIIDQFKIKQKYNETKLYLLFHDGNLRFLSRILRSVECCILNPNTFAGLVGKVQKTLPKEEGREDGEKARTVRPRGLGLEPRTCRLLGEGPQLHARGAV